MKNQIEIWKDIPGYEGHYQVSDLGNVKSLKFGIERILKKTKDTTGYLVCGIYKDGKMKKIGIHQLVTMAFLNHVPHRNKLVVNHKNFIRHDNRLENLEIVTNRENTNQLHLPSISIYTGVFWNKETKKWNSGLRLKSKYIHLGVFDTEKEASEYYQNAVKAIEEGKEIIKKKPKKSSIYKYISFDKCCKRWCVVIKGRKMKNYKTEKEAVEARDKILKSNPLI
jgi:hypothetical protein